MPTNKAVERAGDDVLITEHHERCPMPYDSHRPCRCDYINGEGATHHKDCLSRYIQGWLCFCEEVEPS